MARIATSLVNNLQFFVESIHVRFVDVSRLRDDGTALMCGVMLRRLSGQSTDALWRAMFVPASAARLYKLVQVEVIYYLACTVCSCM
jgi:hypothetical protein